MTDESFLHKFENVMRCAFCLNFRPKNAKQLKEGTAYLCDDCNDADRQPKFVHHISDDKVIETEIPQSQQQQQEIKNAEEQKAPLSDETAKEIAKAIEEDKATQ